MRQRRIQRESEGLNVASLSDAHGMECNPKSKERKGKKSPERNEAMKKEKEQQAEQR
jgi:hypothetical protein